MKTLRKASRGLLLIPALVVALALGLMVLGGLATEAQRQATSGCGGDGAPAGNVVTGPLPAVPGFSAAQLQVAAAMMVAARDAGLTVRAQQLVVTAGIGESSLTAVPHGDAAGPDSLGPLQQRDPWGPREVRMDPYGSATMFLTGGRGGQAGLVDIAGWETLPPTTAIHRVQRNADPTYYTRFWNDGVRIVAALSGAAAGARVQTVSSGGGGRAPVTNSAGPLTPNTQVAVDDVWRAVPGIHSVGGTRASAADPEGHPSGKAADFVVGDDSALGDRVVQYLRDHWDRLGVDYLIWEQRHIDGPADPGSAMDDRGGRAANHFDHVHANFLDTPVAAGGGLVCAEGAGSVAVGPGGWTAPTAGPLTSGFGMRWGSMHNGVDLAPDCGTPIYNAGPRADVVRAGPSSGYGNLIILDHGGGVLTRYAHMFNQDVLVRVGDRVGAGQQIARVGTFGDSTGCHLHAEVQVNGRFVDPVPFFAGRGVAL